MQDGRDHYRFCEPVSVIVARHAEDIAPALARIDEAVTADGLFAAGYLSYEASAAYGLATHAPAGADPPLLWFGLFRSREPISLLPAGDYAFSDWTASMPEGDYYQAVEAIKQAIAGGYTYQANLTFNLRATFAGDPWALYGALCRAQRAAYTAYLDLGRHVICSASPELFLRRQGNVVVSRPMKGTAGRGLTTAEDRAQAAWLQQSEKNRAENVMIVDMIRNDLGRVARVGSVAVPELFAVERYPTLWQMTSTVTAETETNLSDLMRAAFPCASITGAPKVRTMQLLRQLEREPRGVYTGAIGFLTPDGRSQFNVAIRTVVIDREQRLATYGVGSGIVWDSEPSLEYAESLLKARVLNVSSDIPPTLALIESLRWTPEDGYWLLARHMARIADSAEYFGIPLDAGEVARQLQQYAASLAGPAKVRLLVDLSGAVAIESIPLGERTSAGPLRLGLAYGVSSRNPWLYHKTTERAVYEQARASCPDCDDVVLVNERGEVTETCTANLVVELDGERWTPPITSGLLAGTARQELLERGELRERPILVEDLPRAARIWTLNSVRGLQSAELA